MYDCMIFMICISRNVNPTTGQSTYYFTDQIARLEQALVRYTVDYIRNKVLLLLLQFYSHFLFLYLFLNNIINNTGNTI